MSANWKTRITLGVVALMVIGMVLMTRLQPVKAQESAKAMAGRYSVIDTQGHNLLVSDNHENKLYFYTKDKDAPIGSPLKLRASLDLTQIGQPEIKITTHNLEKIDR